MGGTIVIGNVEFVICECMQCHMLFAVTREFDVARRNDHQSFRCPGKGHGQYYPGKSDKEKLQEKLHRKEGECRAYKDELDVTVGTLRAVKGHKTRLAKKLAGSNERGE